MITTQVEEVMTLMGTCSQTARVLSWPCTAALCLSDPAESRNTTGPYYHPDNELAQPYCETFYLLGYRKVYCHCGPVYQELVCISIG